MPLASRLTSRPIRRPAGPRPGSVVTGHADPQTGPHAGAPAQAQVDPHAKPHAHAERHARPHPGSAPGAAQGPDATPCAASGAYAATATTGAGATTGATPGSARLAALLLGLSAASALLGAAAAPAGAIGLPRPGWAVGGDRLAVAYDDGSGPGATRTHTLVCGGVRARVQTDEDAAACGRLAELGGPLGPVPAGQMCSMIYGGPQTARITGVWHGVPVDETYRRTDGCEVARWSQMVPALPSPTADADGGPQMFTT
jgi:hypothetical protein